MNSPSADIHRLPFDMFGRYMFTRIAVETICDTNQTASASILDVGGAGSPLPALLPDHHVVVADKEPWPAPYPIAQPQTFIRSDGTQLPFKSNSIPVVTTHDTLEHVAPHQRAHFLRELLRVSSRFVLVNGPVQRDDITSAERGFARLLASSETPRHRFLDEHLMLGLPEPALLESEFREFGSSHISVPNGNLHAWRLMNGIRVFLDTLPGDHSITQSFDSAYNRFFGCKDYSPPCYRTGYAVALHRQDQSVLEAIEAAFSSRRDEHTVFDQGSYVDVFLAELEDAVREMKSWKSAVEEELTSLEIQYENERRRLGARAGRVLGDFVLAHSPPGSRRRRRYSALKRRLAQGLDKMSRSGER